MKSFILIPAMLLAFSASPDAFKSCDFKFSGDLEVDEQYLTFTYPDATTPNQIRIDQKNRLFIDDKEQRLKPEQEALVAAYAGDIRQAIPEVVELILEATDIGIEATLLALSNLFTGPGVAALNFEENLNNVETALNALQRDVMSNFQDNHFTSTEFQDEYIQHRIEEIGAQAVATVLPEVAGMAVKAMFMSPQALTEFKERAEELEPMIEQRIEKRTEQLRPKAVNLCNTARHLDDLERDLKRSGIKGIEFFEVAAVII